MSILTTLLLVALMVAVVFWLVRGVVAFLKTSETDLNDMSKGPSQSSLKQNKAMMMRILFQGAAILLIVIILAARR
jgi:hypothetical protein